MDTILFWQKAAKKLFFGTGSLLFLLAFFLHNNFHPEISKLLIFILDLPFLFFTLIYLLTSLKINQTEEEPSQITESLLIFLSCFIFALILFFNFAYPDLI